MISKTCRWKFSALAVCILGQATNSFSLAADADSKAELESLAKNDAILRTALSSYERSEEQIRAKFGRELGTLRKTRLQALEQAFARASSKRDTEAVAKLATLINDHKGEQPAELTSPQEEGPLVGTAFRWGSFVMFLAPNGVSWFVNMDAERDVHRFSWTPTGANTIRWKTTHPDPKKQSNTLTIDGNKFSLQADDSKTKENGSVFKP